MGTMTLSYLETISPGVESLEEIFPSSLTSSDKHDVTQKKFPPVALRDQKRNV